jgi:hypothetical protein
VGLRAPAGQNGVYGLHVRDHLIMLRRYGTNLQIVSSIGRYVRDHVELYVELVQHAGGDIFRTTPVRVTRDTPLERADCRQKG